MPIKYLGSKRVLVPLLLRAVRAAAPRGTVLDLFSGTSRVGHALKGAGYRVLANDCTAFAHAIATCYVAADAGTWDREATALLRDLSALPGRPGYFTETFCVRSRYVHPRNGERIDAIRQEIAARALPPQLEAIALVSLMEAADRVDSTTGLQMAYLKQWAPRALGNLELRMPELVPRPAAGECEAHRLDARDAADALEGDVAYLDPPYNQHSYLGNYHVWESLVLGDEPEVYGVACKRVDCRERTSDFNRKTRYAAAWSDLVRRVRARALVVSFSDEGWISPEEMVGVLSSRGVVTVFETDFKRYVGAQIGIFNPRGEKVGAVSHLRNREYVFVVADAPVSLPPGDTPAEPPLFAPTAVR